MKEEDKRKEKELAGRALIHSEEKLDLNEPVKMENLIDNIMQNQNITEFEFDVSDLVIYLRSMMTEFKSHREFNVFLLRIKVLPHLDRIQLLKNYNLVSNVEPNEGRPDVFGYLDGVNEYLFFFFALMTFI